MASATLWQPGETHQSCPTGSQIDTKSGIDYGQQLAVAQQTSRTAGQFVTVKIVFECCQVIRYTERFIQGAFLAWLSTPGTGTEVGQRIICSAEKTVKCSGIHDQALHCLDGKGTSISVVPGRRIAALMVSCSSSGLFACTPSAPKARARAT